MPNSSITRKMNSRARREPLLEVKGLTVEYPGRAWRGRAFKAVDDVSFEIQAGGTLGLVGESGSGKTTIGRAILGLAPVSRGEVFFQGTDISNLKPRHRRALAKEIQVVFQDPYSSLNPAMPIGEILAEPLTAQGTRRGTARSQVEDLLRMVDLPIDSIDRYAREFSGGQRQRVAIARALALQPKLIVCDEPVSALDLTTQARILDLFLTVQERTGVSYLFISHDIDVIRHLSDSIAVMYRGNLVDYGARTEVVDPPREPYVRELLLASPVPDPDLQAERRRQRHELRSAERAVGD